MKRIPDVSLGCNPDSKYANLSFTATSGGRVRNVSNMPNQAYGQPVASARKFVGDEMDKYLNSQGLVRRSLAGRLDETLFRAVSEIVYHSQTSEEVATVERRVRDHLEAARKTRRILEGSPGPRDQLELVRSAAACYRLTIVIYRLPQMPPIVMRAAKSDANSPLLSLYDMGYKYDLIYTMKKHESLAVAQGILYKDLYCNVFGFSHVDIDGVVGRIRKDAESMCVINNANSSPDNGRSLSVNTRPIIPYGAAKSIDCSIYRNVPFDLANRILKMAKSRGNSSGNVRYPQESYCLARRGDKFESAKVVGVIGSDIRLVRYVDNIYASLSTMDLRDRGVSYNNVSQSEVNKQRIPVEFSMSSATLSTELHFVPRHAQSMAAQHTPIMSRCPNQMYLPPTYYANQATVPSSIEHYLHPDSPKCTWWDRNLSQTNRAQDQYETWSSANQPCSSLHEHWFKISGEQYPTASDSDFNDNLDSMATGSPSLLSTICEVPFISRDKQKLVDTTVSFSYDENGSDLPTDINTLRYFFNLGISAYQDRQMSSLDSLQDICPNSSISESLHDIFASDDEVMPSPYMMHVPQFDGTVGDFTQCSPRKQFQYSPGFQVPPSSAPVLPMRCTPFHGFNGEENRFF